MDKIVSGINGVVFVFSGDMLGGHLDDMEKDWSKPIVSMRYLAITCLA